MVPKYATERQTIAGIFAAVGVPALVSQQLEAVTRRNGSPFFSLDEREIVLEVINYLRQGETPETMLNYVTQLGAVTNNPRNIIWSSQRPAIASARLRVEQEKEFLLEESEGAIIEGKVCVHCGGTRIWAQEMQTRGCDEETTIIYTCTSCKRRTH